MSGSEIRRLPRLLKAREAAGELHCSLPHIYALGRSGDLPTARILRAVRFDAHAVITMQRGRLWTIPEVAVDLGHSEDFISRHLDALDAIVIDGRTYIPDAAVAAHKARVQHVLSIPAEVAS